MSWPGVVWTDPDAVLGTEVDPAPPPAPCPTGYGRRVPTRYRIQYVTETGRRWRRVYAVDYGRHRSLYVVADGAWRALDPATRARVERATCNAG